MAKKKKKKATLLQLIKETWFYKIYFLLLTISIVAIVIGVNVLTGVMKEYEETRPIHLAEEVFNIVQSRNWDQLRTMDTAASALNRESPELYSQYMDEVTAGKTFTLKTLIPMSDDESKYSILADGQKFAEITLEHSGEKTAHNMEGWRLRSIETKAIAHSEYTVTAPADSTVKVNGTQLTDSDIIERGIKTEADGNLPDGIEAPTLEKYAIQLAFGAPETVEVIDVRGNPQEVTQKDDKTWYCGLSYDDSLRDKWEAGVIKWGKNIALYTMGDYSKSSLSKACVDPSPARTYIRNMQNNWAAKHSGSDFENIKTFNYYAYSDDCFSASITFDNIVHYPSQDKVYPASYTLYFQKKGGNYKLYSITFS